MDSSLCLVNIVCSPYISHASVCPAQIQEIKYIFTFLSGHSLWPSLITTNGALSNISISGPAVS